MSVPWAEFCQTLFFSHHVRFSQILKQSEMEYDNEANGIAVGPDGSVVLAGNLYGSKYYQEFSDFLVVKLDSNGNEVWTFQVRDV